MFTKEEEKALRSEFWDILLKELRQHKSAEGRKINWLKYPTGMKDVFIRGEADHNGCRICLDFQFKNNGIRELFWEQLLETKTVFENTMDWPVNWIPNFKHSYGTEISRVCVEYPNTHLFRKKDWPQMHQFMVKQFRNFDTYWSEFNELYFMLYK